MYFGYLQETSNCKSKQPPKARRQRVLQLVGWLVVGSFVKFFFALLHSLSLFSALSV